MNNVTGLSARKINSQDYAASLLSRIKKVLVFKNKSIAGAARYCEVWPVTMGRHMNGKTPITLDMFVLLLIYAEIDPTFMDQPLNKEVEKTYG